MFDDWQDEEEDSSPVAEQGEGLLPPRLSAGCRGHEAQEKMFLSLIAEGRMPHAMIFTGPKGIGKSAMAFRLARYLLKNGAGDSNQGGLFGDAPPAPESLHVAADDPVFRKVAAGGHPDLLTVERPFDEKTGKFKDSVDIDSIRAVAPFLHMTASEGGWRVVIVDDADTMTRAAQNGLLKILEEPPPQALLILIAHGAGGLIPTIRSRARAVAFQPLSPEAMKDLLQQAGAASDAAEIEGLTAMAEGSIGAALRIAEQGGLESVNQVVSLLSQWPRWRWTDIHRLAETVGRKGSEPAYQGFQDTLLWAASAMLRARARGQTELPRPLTQEPLRQLLAHNSLEQWIEICENLSAHFRQIETGNLDKRQGVLGAFAVLEARQAGAR